MRPLVVNEKREEHRRFNLADGLILTAAIAATLAILRDAPDRSHYIWMGSGFTSYGSPPFALRAAVRASLVLFPWTVAIFLVRLRRPRPPLPCLVRQPGFAACGAVSVWVGSKVLLLGLMSLGVPQKRVLVKVYLGDGLAVVSWSAPAVAAAWLVLALSGQWRAEPGWIDRLGRAIGASWLVLEVANSVRLLF